MENQTVKLSSDSTENTSTGTIYVQHWDPKARLKRALKLGGFCWAAAIVSIFLPIVHFILVPAFFVAGPLVAIHFHGQKSVIAGGEGKCPKCGADFTVARAPYKFPISDLCVKCRAQVRINLPA